MAKKKAKKKAKGKGIDIKVLLSTLWIFVMLNYLYCDYIGLLDPELLKQIMAGVLANGMVLNQGFLLGASIMMEIPIVMILISRIAKYGLNRWANIIAGVMMSAVQIASLFVDTPTMYYSFFSVVEISTTALIVVLAWRWKKA